MGIPNISLATASVDGVDVSFTGSGPFGVGVWTLDDDVNINDFSGSVSIILDFDEAHILSAGTDDPYAIVDSGNLDDIFSAYTLVIDPDTGVLTLTFDPDNFLGPDTASFEVSGRGDAGDTVVISFVCFAEGTIIETVNGPKKVEELRVNDLVPTKSHGVKPIRWIGSRHLDSIDLAANPHMRPVEIHAGALGEENPSIGLTVSPQHRVFIASPELQLLFGVEEALVPAKGLLNGESVLISDQSSVTYYHVLFDQHELIKSNGAWTESLYPGKQAILTLGHEAYKELFDLFPELQSDETDHSVAAPMLTAQETRLLAGALAKSAG